MGKKNPYNPQLIQYQFPNQSCLWWSFFFLFCLFVCFLLFRFSNSKNEKEWKMEIKLDWEMIRIFLFVLFSMKHSKLFFFVLFKSFVSMMMMSTTTTTAILTMMIMMMRFFFIYNWIFMNPSIIFYHYYTATTFLEQFPNPVKCTKFFIFEIKFYSLYVLYL